MDVSIKNISDLQEEIARIRVIEARQGEELAKRFNSPSAIFGSIMSLLNAGNRDGDDQPSIFNQDFFGLLSRIVLPVTLNKTLFKRSNILVKTLVGLVSQKASNYISGDSIHGLWDKIKSVALSVIKSKPETTHKGGMPNVPPPVVM
ncbi:hypothetical protein AB6735_26885 [Mucilaginibacter sp. RCC_168]|jgi:hypothetical protein|uniref:hypothetical protein n=1 Tax=Mucilaginibacter sp. RCC_168 TaxID=3239221 RepID=UPI0035233554